MKVGVIVCMLLVGGAAHAASLWEHNGSTVYLEADGASRKFFYQRPRQELPVTKGTLLFSGRKDGDHYSGVAYVFSKKCGPARYAVSGPVSTDQRTVTMYGNAPVRNSSCEVVSYRKDVLSFSFQDPDKSLVSGSIGEGKEREWCRDSYRDFAAAWLSNGYVLDQCTPKGWVILRSQKQDGVSCAMLHPTYGFAIWISQADVPHSMSLHRLIPRRTHMSDGQVGKVRLIVDRKELLTEIATVRREAMALPAYRLMIDVAPQSLWKLASGASLMAAITDGDSVDAWEFNLSGSRFALEQTFACAGLVE